MRTTTRIQAILGVMLVLCLYGTVSAQECGQGVPCGPIPWRMPSLPDLSSPTPMPTLAVTQSSANPGPGTPTHTPTATTTPYAIDTSDIEQQISIINGLMVSTPGAIATNIPGANILNGGTNILTNGEFDSGGTGWTLTSGGQTVTFASGQASWSQPPGAMASTGIRQNGVLTIGNQYTLRISVPSLSVTSGAGLRISGTSGVTNTYLLTTTPGVFNVNFTAAEANFMVWTQTTTVASVVIESVHVSAATTSLSALTENTALVFGYLRGLDASTFGPMAPLVTLLLIALVLVITVKIATFMLPIIAVVFGVLRKIVSLILEFLPL